jgi:hypothetical protein
MDARLGRATAQVGSGRFRSMNVGELLDAVFSLYRRNFLLIAAISAIVQVPFAALEFLIFELTGYSALQQRLQDASQSLQGLQPGQAPPDQLQLVAGDLGTLFLITAALAIVGLFVVQPLAVAATTRAVSDRYLDHDASIGASYSAALRRLGALIVQSLVLTVGAIVLVGGGFIVIALMAAALGAPSIPIILLLVAALVALVLFVYVRTSLAVPSIVLERLSGWNGLVRSWELVRGLSWRMLGIRLLLAIITFIITGVVTVLFSVAGAALDANGRFIVQQVASALATVFVSPITYIAVTLLYYDARIRKEAFDIEMLAQTL